VNLWQYLDAHPWMAFGALVALWTLADNIKIRLGRGP